MTQISKTGDATPEQQKRFITDCWNGLMDEVVECVAKNPQAVHWRDPETQDTGLTCAVARGIMKYDLVKFLLDAGSDVNACDKNGMTPLMIGVKDGSEAYADLFLSLPSDTALRNLQGKTAYDIAGESRRQSVIDVFDRQRDRLARDAAAAAQRAEDTRQKTLREEIATICTGTRRDVSVGRLLPDIPRRRGKP